MKEKKSRIGQIVSILGGALILAPVAFATAISLWQIPMPSGGGGPAINATFNWEMNAANPHSFGITATMVPQDARLKRVRWGWILKDDTVDTLTRPSRTIWVHPYWWRRARRVDSSSSANMTSGHNYYLEWDAWNAYASCGSTATSPKGRGSDYACF